VVAGVAVGQLPHGLVDEHPLELVAGPVLAALGLGGHRHLVGGEAVGVGGGREAVSHAVPATGPGQVKVGAAALGPVGDWFWFGTLGWVGGFGRWRVCCVAADGSLNNQRGCTPRAPSPLEHLALALALGVQGAQPHVHAAQVVLREHHVHVDDLPRLVRLADLPGVVPLALVGGVAADAVHVPRGPLQLAVVADLVLAAAVDGVGVVVVVFEVVVPRSALGVDHNRVAVGGRDPRGELQQRERGCGGH